MELQVNLGGSAGMGHKVGISVEAKNRQSEAAEDLIRFGKAFPVDLVGRIVGAAAKSTNDIVNYIGELRTPSEVCGESLLFFVADLICFAGAGLILLANKVLQATAEYFGFEEKVARPTSEQAKSNAKDALNSFGKIEEYTPSSILPSEGGTTHEENSAFIYKCCLAAVAGQPEIKQKIEAGDISGLLNVINNAKETPCAETTKGIELYFEQAYLKAGGKDVESFRNEVIKAQGIYAPKELKRTFAVNLIDNGHKKSIKFVEKATNIDASLGAKYLKAIGNGEKYISEINYIEAHGHSGVKLSRERANPDSRGMLVNGSVHSVTSEIGKNITISKSVLRSGAFAIQDKAKIGLDGLKAKKAEIELLASDIANSKKESVADGRLLESLRQDLDNEIDGGNIQQRRGILMDLLENEEEKRAQIETNEAKLAAMKTNFEKAGGDAEIKRRTDLTVSQALPKISASIKEIAKNPIFLQNALKTGGFLHVEQSFLSDQDSSERVMIEDMKGAMDHIRENATVKFTNDPEGENVEINPDTGEILLTLYVADLQEVFEKKFKLNTIYFTQGVNEKQSFGHLFKMGTSSVYQDEVNEKSLKDLLEYAQFFVENGVSLDQDNIKVKIEEIKKHFSEGNFRKGKDIEGVRLIASLVEVLGGGRGVVCKSGKDRTGSEVNDSLAAAMAEKVSNGREEIKKVLHKEVRNALAEGISLRLTGLNTGKSDGYAFNPGQLETLPEEWRPPKHLCNPKSDS